MLFKRPMHVLMEGAGDDGAASGGAGAPAAGAAGAGATPTAGAAATFTPEQQRALNAAISAHMARLEKKIPTADTFKDAFAGLLEEKFKAFQPAAPAAAGGAATGAPSGDAVPEPVKQELARMKSELDKATQRAENERRQREEEQTKSKRNEERGAITTALRENQVPEHLIRTLVPYLHAESGRVKRDESGTILFGVPRPEWSTLPAEDRVEWMPIGQGLTAWLTGTEEGKSYLPPREARGSGARGGSVPGVRAKKLEEVTNADIGLAIMESMGRG